MPFVLVVTAHPALEVPWKSGKGGPWLGLGWDIKELRGLARDRGQDTP